MTALSERGANQRRQRAKLAKRGWCTLNTYVRVQYRAKLVALRRQRGLRNLHETLDLVLTAYLEQGNRPCEASSAGLGDEQPHG